MDSEAALKYLQSVVKDTTPEMLLLQQEIWQNFSDEKKLMLTMEQMDINMDLLKAGILKLHPQWTQEEVQIETLTILYKNNLPEGRFAKMIESVKQYNQKATRQNHNEE